MVVVQPNVEVRVRLFGRNLLLVQTLMFTTNENECSDVGLGLAIPSQEFKPLDPDSLAFAVTFVEEKVYYVCFSWSVPDSTVNETIQVEEWVHQGNKEYQRISVERFVQENYMPLPLQIIFLCFLLLLSGLFSGLNLGLMTLNKTELKIILKCGDKKERKFAEKIYPVRKSGNYLLCTLLIGNVIVNSAISILFDDLTSGYIALLVSSFGIVIFGEIVPQAVCSRYGLAVGAYTVWITKFFMVLTSPMSWPISRILDKVLGEEVPEVYNRDHLLELIRLSKEQESDLKNCQEVQIVTGALELSHKRVCDVMVNIHDVYTLSSDAVLDPATVNDIVRVGYTRIPVHESSLPSNIIGILNVKDLALLDPEDLIPLNTICKFYHHPVRFVMEDTPLSIMLEEFRKGNYHMAIVQRINSEGDGDPVYENVGLVTLEDIIEEIIQMEIMDEFDVIRENRRRRKKKIALTSVASTNVRDLDNPFFNPDEETCALSNQLALAAFQYLSANLEAFRVGMISEQVLHRLIRQNVLRTKPAESYEPPKYLYEKGREADHFVLLLEGHASITVGQSDLLFEVGPFHYFGYEVLAIMAENAPRISMSSNINCNIEAMAGLKKPTLVPDFTVKVTQETIYLRLSAAAYLTAYRATLIERGASSQRLVVPSSTTVSNVNSVTSLPNVKLMKPQRQNKQPLDSETSTEDFRAEEEAFTDYVTTQACRSSPNLRRPQPSTACLDNAKKDAGIDEYNGAIC